jgi:hypothetical protein
METFYTDKNKLFEFNVAIEGASINDTKVRLVLNTDDKNYLYYGTINENGKCSIDIPPLKDIKSTKGNVILEVISESTFFEPWTSEVEIKKSKSVVVEMINNTTKPKLEEKKVNVQFIKEEKQVITPKLPEKSLNEIVVEKLITEIKNNNISNNNILENKTKLKSLIENYKLNLSESQQAYIESKMFEIIKSI